MKFSFKKIFSWRSWHKWVGLVFSVFILFFCLSGIVMNHRSFFSGCEVSRSWLPAGYHIQQWNQQIVKGTFPLDKQRTIVYGQAGLWLTTPDLQNWQDFNTGIDEGIDNRKISNVVRTSDGTLWCAGLFKAYRFVADEHRWVAVELPDNDERISDLALRGQDTLVVMTRSQLYEAVKPFQTFQAYTLQTPAGYENRVTLFKTVWMLHSGDLFGLPGRLVVDCIAAILIALCVTGIVFFILPYSIRRTNRRLKQEPSAELQQQVRREASWLKDTLRWHNRLGAGAIILTLLLSVTGMCLRPPLMIPLALTKTAPVPGSTMASKNVFHDKLRGLRWDHSRQCWLVSTSEGFFQVGADLGKTVPVALPEAPTVSPMGINVFTPNPEQPQEWLIGSFSGLFSWNPTTGQVTDWFTGEAPQRGGYGAVGSHTVTGWSTDLTGGPVVFDYYSAPNRALPEMPEVLKNQPMSLWNFALELHVGRCYEPFLGSVLSVLYVFLTGLTLTLVLLSGYILYRRSLKKKQKQ